MGRLWHPVLQLQCAALLLASPAQHRHYLSSQGHSAAVVATTPDTPETRACAPGWDDFPFCNSRLPLPQRVNDLITRLRLEEKAPLLTARESPKGNVSRLGLPEYDWGGNCVHGVQSRCVGDVCPTMFPSPNSLGRSSLRQCGL
mgnify:CR=1 FL=1